MKIAIICPTKYLSDFAKCCDGNYHAVLAHRYLSDVAYGKFYEEEREKGSTILLDNGACELKSSISDEHLYSVSIRLKPDIVVLPDVLNDADKTIERTFSFVKKYPQLKRLFGVKYMAVPQGLTKQLWMKSFMQFYTSDSIDMLGFSNVEALNTKHKKGFNRVDAIRYLLSEGYDFSDKKIHILGLGDSGHIEVESLKSFSFIEGLDTSAPVVHGYHGVIFEKNKPYMKIRSYLPDDLNQMSPMQRENILTNIKILYDATK